MLYEEDIENLAVMQLYHAFTDILAGRAFSMHLAYLLCGEGAVLLEDGRRGGGFTMSFRSKLYDWTSLLQDEISFDDGYWKPLLELTHNVLDSIRRNVMWGLEELDFADLHDRVIRLDYLPDHHPDNLPLLVRPERLLEHRRGTRLSRWKMVVLEDQGNMRAGESKEFQPFYYSDDVGYIERLPHWEVA
jgi:hypothetical protein